MNKTLVIKAKGGMGNRMLCTVTGLLLAEILKRKPVVDWSDGAYAEEGINAFPFFFKSGSCSTELPFYEGKNIVPDIWNRNLNQSVSRMIHKYDPKKHSSILIHRKYSVDPSCSDIQGEIAVYWSYTERIRRLGEGLSELYPESARMSKEQKLSYFIPRFLLLQDGIQNEIEKIKETVWENRVIGVHVRHTDRQISLERYKKPINRMLEKHPGAAIFLATDNPHVNEFFKSQYSHVITLEKWYPEDSSALHQNYTCPDKVRNGIEALVDMYLLAECDALIYPGNSTFSWISSLISKAPRQDRIDVTSRNVKVMLKKIIREFVQ